MGKPTRGNALVSPLFGRGDTGGSETSQYPQEEKATRPERAAPPLKDGGGDSLSSGERKGNSPNRMGAKPAGVAHAGLRGLTGRGRRPAGKLQIHPLAEQGWKTWP